MLTSKIRTPEETAAYMRELKGWLAQVRDAPAEDMADFFAARLGEYEDVHLAHWGEEYAHIADYFADEPSTLLDIGCGTGLELLSLYARFPALRVTGVDLSASMLAKLRDNYKDKNIEIIQADYFTCPLPENHYDAALSVETLHHFPYDKKQRIYNRLYKTVRAGGVYVECDYVACCDEEEALCLEGWAYRREKNAVPPDAFVHIDIPLTMEHQLALMRQAGFRQVDVLYQKEGTVIFRAVK